MRLLLIDSFNEPMPPSGPGNASRFFYGLLKGANDVVLSVKKNVQDYVGKHDVFRPGTVRAAQEFAARFDAVVMPPNDWYVGGMKVPLNECLNGLKNAYVYGGAAKNAVSLARSTLEDGLVVRHCVDPSRNDVKTERKSVVTFSGVTKRTLSIAAEACRRCRLNLVTFGNRFDEAPCASLGIIPEVEKWRIISSASLCLIICDEERPVGSPSILEPGAYGVPTAVIYSNRSAASEYILHGTTGIVMKIDGDMEVLTNAAVEALRAAEGMSRMTVKDATLDLYLPKPFHETVTSAIIDETGPYS
ncbi:MAG: hypothetical protein Q8K86_05740 [Candidatus Nanopelagicaceae bacterium]|nr:hypothetical protein [Candidatus Nanopelagicaceae bacterium]